MNDQPNEKVQRYALGISYTGLAEVRMVEHPYGHYVEYSDYAALRAQYEAAFAKATKYWEQMAEAELRAEAAEQRAREVEADARRYAWLREGDNDELVLLNADGTPVPAMDPDKCPACFLPRLERLDSAIDAAMQGATQDA